MKMKIYSMLFLGMMWMLAGCKKYTDIVPKGRNILNKVSDLDYLLNYNWVGAGFNFEDAYVITNDMYPLLSNVPGIISNASKGLDYARVTYDESVDRISLTTTDIKYERLYPIITNVADIVIMNADGASGDRALANRYKAEAYIIRAYLHYLLVNFYAKAYDPATAATDGGIPYVKEDHTLEVPNQKYTVQEVYDNILADIDASFNLNALPDVPVNNMRVGKAVAYAVKAKVLLSLRKYAEALQAADAGLALKSGLEDHRPFLPAPYGSGLAVSRLGLTAPDNLFYSAYINSRPGFYGPSLEIWNSYYEPGNIIKEYTTVYTANTFTGMAGTYYWSNFNYFQNASGLSTTDLYLARAESLARTGNVTEAMNVINNIRVRRIHPNTYAPLTATTEAQAMAYIKKTARIEYLFTYKNFIDIKRWNTEAAYKQTITRTVNGITYSLTPESKLWIFPFPQSATNYNSNLTQNY